MANSLIPPVLKGSTRGVVAVASVFTVIGLVVLLLPIRTQVSVGGFPFWLLGAMLILVSLWYWIALIRTHGARRSTPPEAD
ncbi:hypothetical protein [Curtobacterium sp. MCBD17_040]|uniref:hypothetical protein n=1 Tax=Curtobacterium sp. MCBD17_040 TaxID=2175674 RepID=UPI000DAA125E|nr:hypothetical protein [Curtobacterium sp. MCBD17_040]WIB65697.1 hypothetical protein DEI94_16380 [Curtobacterium sp. MCBD17_040]